MEAATLLTMVVKGSRRWREPDGTIRTLQIRCRLAATATELEEGNGNKAQGQQS